MSSHDRFRNRTGIFPQGFKLPTFQDICLDNPYLTNVMANPAVMVLNSTCGGNITPHSQSHFTFARQPVGGRLEGGKESAVSTAGAIPFPSPFPVRPIYGQGDFLLPLQHSLLAGHPLNRGYLHPGAFRPLTNLADDRNAAFHGSAFMPAKCLKLDGHSPGSDISSATQPLLLGTCFQGSGSESSFHQSPANSTASSLGQTAGSFLDGKDDRGDSDSMADGADRMSETPNLSEESRSIERSTPEDRSTPKRLKKFYFDGQSPYCPICLQPVSLADLDAHYEMEKKRLDEEIRKCVNQQLEAVSLHSPFSSPMCIVRKEDKGKPESRWENFQRVKSNRTTRLTSARCLIKRKKWDQDDRGQEDNLHLLTTGLRKRESHDFSPETSIDSRAAAEINWARMQAFVNLQRNLTDFSARKFETPDDENQELNVDEDDSAMYGQPHYTEADVITCSSEDNADSKEQIRRIQSNDFNYQRHPDSNQWAVNGGNNNGEGQEVTSTCVTNNDAGSECVSPSSVKVSKPDKDASDNPKDQVEDGIKCLICNDTFIKPVVSICCWHVHCEECWLKSLGTKKLCPQCNIITAAKDLRRIYL